MVALSTAVAVLSLPACGLVTSRAPADLGAEARALSGDDVGTGVVELARFFGDCEDTTSGQIDVSKATNECEVVQILTNAYNDESSKGGGPDVERLGGAQFAAYYDTLNATFAGGAPPDVAVMHAAPFPTTPDVTSWCRSTTLWGRPGSTRGLDRGGTRRGDLRRQDLRGARGTCTPTSGI